MRNTPWTDEQRAAALAAVEALGLAEAHRETGVPKTTLSGWCRDAGIVLEGADVERVAHAKAAAQAVAARSILDLVPRLLDIAALGAELELSLLRLGLTAANGTSVQRAKATARIAGLVEALPSLSMIVGSRTRAIHDLQLLTGHPTEQPAALRPALDAGPAALLDAGTSQLSQLRQAS